MKRVTYFTAILLAATLLLGPATNVSAQDEKESPISIGADLVSRYVWRGLDYGASPSIQPYIELGLGGFAFGAWGAYTTNFPGVQEMDFYASYTISVVSVGLTDYFFPDEILGYDYFNYDNHTLEAFASFNGLEDLPITAMMGVNLMGDNNNSLYFELGYSFSILDIFVGAGNGLYTTNQKFNVVNIGISATKEIPVTEKYSIPLSASLITNPEAKGIHLVFGISF